MFDFYNDPEYSKPLAKKQGEPEPNVNPCVNLFGKGVEGVQCKYCAHLKRFEQGGKWMKCVKKPTHTRGVSGDHRAGWQSCAQYERSKEW